MSTGSFWMDRGSPKSFSFASGSLSTFRPICITQKNFLIPLARKSFARSFHQRISLSHQHGCLFSFTWRRKQASENLWMQFNWRSTAVFFQRKRKEFLIPNQTTGKVRRYWRYYKRLQTVSDWNNVISMRLGWTLAVTKSWGLGTQDLGLGTWDSRTWDAGTRGHRDAVTRWPGDVVWPDMFAYSFYRESPGYTIVSTQGASNLVGSQG